MYARPDLTLEQAIQSGIFGPAYAAPGIAEAAIAIGAAHGFSAAEVFGAAELGWHAHRNQYGAAYEVGSSPSGIVNDWILPQLGIAPVAELETLAGWTRDEAHALGEVYNQKKRGFFSKVADPLGLGDTVLGDIAGAIDPTIPATLGTAANVDAGNYVDPVGVIDSFTGDPETQPIDYLGQGPFADTPLRDIGRMGGRVMAFFGLAVAAGAGAGAGGTAAAAEGTATTSGAELAALVESGTVGAEGAFLEAAALNGAAVTYNTATGAILSATMPSGAVVTFDPAVDPFTQFGARPTPAPSSSSVPQAVTRAAAGAGSTLLRDFVNRLIGGKPASAQPGGAASADAEPFDWWTIALLAAAAIALTS